MKFLALVLCAILLFAAAAGVAPAQQPTPGPPVVAPVPPILLVPAPTVPPVVIVAPPAPVVINPNCMTLGQWVRYRQAWRSLAHYRYHKTLAERR